MLSLLSRRKFFGLVASNAARIAKEALRRIDGFYDMEKAIGGETPTCAKLQCVFH